jgi:hypothetical protein
MEVDMAKSGTLSTAAMRRNMVDKRSIWARLRRVFAQRIDYERMPERLRRDAGLDADVIARSAARKAPLIR